MTNGWSLCELYRTLETPGANRLRDAYGTSASDDILAFLLNLNLTCAARETAGAPHYSARLARLRPESSNLRERGRRESGLTRSTPGQTIYGGSARESGHAPTFHAAFRAQRSLAGAERGLAWRSSALGRMTSGAVSE